MFSVDDIRSALSDGELRLFFQPKVSLISGQVIGAEALIRWCRKDGTVIGPDAFLSTAEAGGLLHSITLEMLSQAVLTLENLGAEFPGMSLSMNVTPSDLASHKISELISGYLGDERIRAQDLQIEITESEVMTRFEHVFNDIVHLSELGIDVLMDDFGVGYSSIDRLSQLPFSSLKLDKGVVSRMSSSRQNLNVVKSAISMARELGMTSVAEGVESESAYNFLVASGCEQAQGFWISKPLYYQDYVEFLREKRTYQGSMIGRVHQAGLNITQFRKSLIDAVFCQLVASNELPPVPVTHTEARLNPDNSPFGIWYYGVGQELTGREVYKSLEAPFRTLYEQAHLLMRSAQEEKGRDVIDRQLEQLDSTFRELIRRLQVLERDLLCGSYRAEISFDKKSSNVIGWPK